MREIKQWAMAFLVLLSTASTAGAWGVEFAIGGWAQEPSGSLGYKALSGDDILDIENDLNYEQENQVTGWLKIKMPLFLPNIYLMVTPMAFKETGQKEGGFKFGDAVFDSAPFESETVLDRYDVGLYYGIPLLETATFDKLNIDVGLNVRIFDYKLTFSQESTGFNKSGTKTLPVPMIFLAAQLRPIERLFLEAEGRGISYSGYDVFSLIGRIKYRITESLFAAGGYRYEKSKIDKNDLQSDTEFSGPFLEVGFSFGLQ